MRILPKYNYVIHTDLHPTAVTNVLEQETDPKTKWVFSFSRKSKHLFVGKIQKETFIIWKNIQYINSFLPIVDGEVIETPKGSDVHLTLRAHGIVRVFWYFWYGFLILSTVLLFFTNASLMSFVQHGFFWILPPIMTWGGFLFEKDKTIQLIETTLGSKTSNQRTQVDAGLRPRH